MTWMTGEKWAYLTGLVVGAGTGGVIAFRHGYERGYCLCERRVDQLQRHYDELAAGSQKLCESIRLLAKETLGSDQT